MDKTKRGIALFITLLIIASILSIVAVSFSYLEKVQRDASKVSAIIQGDILYKDTTEILRRIFPKGKADGKKLNMLYTLPLMISEPKSGLNINLKCEPLLRAVPIKWLDENFTKQIPQRFELAKKVLSSILEKFDIKEPNRLEELILSNITDIELEDREYSYRLDRAKGIVSKEQFYKILLEYRLQYDDDTVFKIAWDRYFVFVDVTEKALIDGAYVTPEVISIAFDIPLESVKDDWVERSSNIDEEKITLKKFLTENDMAENFDKKLFSDSGLNAMHCEERFAYRENFYSFSFDYSNERSLNFEFNGEI